MQLIRILLILALFPACSPKKESNFDISQYEGITLDGEKIVLSESRSETLVLNVYSPTCVPCIREIPVVNHLYEYLENSKKARFYIVTDPYSIVDNSEKMSFEEVSEKARFILKDDSIKRKIFAPILIMKPPFRVAPGKGLVTGMPETLLFRTQPLRLFYNFIGPISEEQNPVLIPKDSKVQFIKRMIGG